MVLIIDTTQKECLVGLYNGKNIKFEKWTWKTDTGSEVLKRISLLLKKDKINIDGIESIYVNQGPGSYTGTRVGIVIANTLGWASKSPVYGYKNDNIGKITKKIFIKLKSGKIPLNHFPAPVYK